MYEIYEHRHVVAVWAAATAARASANCRFSVEDGRRWLETGLNLGERGRDCRNLVESPDKLPPPGEFEKWHRHKRDEISVAAGRNDVTHGVAAKLLNVYLKVIFVCGGSHDHPNVVVVHPPVDSLLLSGLAAHPVMGPIAQWESYAWSTLNSSRYEELIAKMRAAWRACEKGKPFWAIEEHWRGHQ